MKKLQYILLFVPFVLFGQNITSDMFVENDFNGSWMSIMLEADIFEQFNNNAQLAAFSYDCCSEEYRCVGITNILDGSVTNDFLRVFTTYDNNCHHNGCDSVSSQIVDYAILYEGSVIYLIPYTHFLSPNGVILFNNDNVQIYSDDYQLGCTYSTAFNYNPLAELYDGSCLFLASEYILNQLNQSFDAWNVSIDLSSGWNMFGYGCPSSINVADGLSNHTESIIITKDNSGNVYMPEFGFNGIGDFTPGFGYQIKLTEAIEGFSLCDWYVNDIPEDNIISMQDSIDILNSDILDLECVNQGACSFNIALNECEFAQEGYDCEGNFILQVGDYGLGGIIYHIDETGNHGLVVLDYDLTSYTFGCYDQNCPADSYSDGLINTIAMEEYCGEINEPYGNPNIAYYVRNTSLNGYDDWYVPAIEELSVLMVNLIVGNWSTVNGSACHPYGFSYNKNYGSSTEHMDNQVQYFLVSWANNGGQGPLEKHSNGYYFRPIRSF